MKQQPQKCQTEREPTSRSRSPKPIRVLVVEDSRAQRELLVGILQASGTFEVVGTARTGREAVESAHSLRPDIIAMDIHLPVFDGYEATRQIMQHCPTPIVMVSNSAGDEGRRSLSAQTVGALAVVRKPGAINTPTYQHDRETLLKTLRLMAGVPVVTRHARRLPPNAGKVVQPVEETVRLLAIAASTGGPAAVQQILNDLGGDFPLPVVLAQHIAEGFVTALADWLNATTPLTVKVARAGEQLLPGHVYLAPDSHHLTVRMPDQVVLSAASSGDTYCPSADRLFASVTKAYGPQAIGLILTGMGSDGATGLRALHDTGAYTLAQDEASCVVYGMPQAAAQLDAVTRVEPLATIGRLLRQQVLRQH
jgi:two-component system chemotaxis response regulator CheB